MGEIIWTVIFLEVERVIQNAVDEAINWVVEKTVDLFGNTVTEIVYYFDGDGDGSLESREVLYTIDTLIPDLDNGYCLCNDGNKIGLGFPAFEIVDGYHVGQYMPHTPLMATQNGILVDYDGDLAVDDVLVPLGYDVTGDGVDDWGWLVDDDNNGLPDVSSDSPFYPVGSEQYTAIVKAQSGEELGIMEKPIADYSVTEGILLIGFIVGMFGVVAKLFRRRKVM